MTETVIVAEAPVSDEQKQYDLLVKMGIDQTKQDARGQWHWGDLINKVTALGDIAISGVNNGSLDRIKKYIEDTGCNLAPNTLQAYAQVAKTFPVGTRIASFAAHQILQGSTVRDQIVPGMGYAEAKRALSEFRAPEPSPTSIKIPADSDADHGFVSDVSAEQAEWDAVAEAVKDTLTFSEEPCQVQPWDPDQGFLRKFSANLKLQMKPAVLRNQPPETLRTILEHVQETRALLDQYEAAVRRAEKKSSA